MDYLSEDFLGLGNTKPIKQCLKFALEKCEREKAGAFVFTDSYSDYKFIEMTNLNKFNSNYFILNNKKFYKYYKDKRVISLFHTHVCRSATPSIDDIELSNSLKVPSFIMSQSSKDSFLYYPPKCKTNQPLHKRIFIPFFQDCVTFVKDFYLDNLRIDLTKDISNWARARTNSNKKLITEIEKNFNKISFNEIKFGDVMVSPQSMSNLMHLSVVGESKLLHHHPIGTYPKAQIISSEYNKKVYIFYRYKDL